MAALCHEVWINAPTTKVYEAISTADFAWGQVGLCPTGELLATDYTDFTDSSGEPGTYVAHIREIRAIRGQYDPLSCFVGQSRQVVQKLKEVCEKTS